MTAPAISGTWSGALESSGAYLDRIAAAMPIAYALSPELGKALEVAIAGGQAAVTFAQAMSSGTDAQKANAITGVVQFAIAVRKAVAQHLAKETAKRFQTAIEDERDKTWRKVMAEPHYWPIAVVEPSRIHEDVKGRSALELAAGVPGEVWGRVFKPERPDTFRFLPVSPGGQLPMPTGCGATPPPGGVDVEGTWQEGCSGEVALYALLWPCFRERSLSTGGEYSPAKDPELRCLELQQRVLFDPAANLIFDLDKLEEVVSIFEQRFWSRVAGRKSPTNAAPSSLTPSNAGIFGTVSGVGGGFWGLQVLDEKPKDAQHDQRFYIDSQGVIRTIWRDSDLDTCWVAGEGLSVYDPDTGDRGRCTLRARNTVWSLWRSINTARKFWSTRPYIREQWAAKKLVVSPDAAKDLATPIYTVIAGPASAPSQAPPFPSSAAPAEAPLSTGAKILIGVGATVVVGGAVAGGVVWYRRRRRARAGAR